MVNIDEYDMFSELQPPSSTAPKLRLFLFYYNF